MIRGDEIHALRNWYGYVNSHFLQQLGRFFGAQFAQILDDDEFAAAERELLDLAACIPFAFITAKPQPGLAAVIGFTVTGGARQNFGARIIRLKLARMSSKN